MNIVIVGGGFGGVKAALELSKRRAGKITLISDEDYFLHHATLYATATGKSYAESVIPLDEIFESHPSVTVVKDKITGFDPARKLVTGKKDYRYDYLILAMGSVTTYFGIKGMQEHSYGIKSRDEIRQFQAHIHDELVLNKFDKEYFVIGAGPTGVELAGALNEYLNDLIKLHRLKAPKVKVTLVEAAPRILPRSSETAAKIVSQRLKKLGIRVLVNHKVEALDDDHITIEGRKIPTTTAVWTSGVANNPFFAAHASVLPLDKNNRVNVNKHLEALPHVYVVGDNNTVKYSGMASPAMKQAKYVAKHIVAKIHKRPIGAYRPHSVPSGLPVGEKWGYVEWLGIYQAGWLGYWLRRLIELNGYHKLMPLRKAVPIWRAHDIEQVDS